MIPHFHDGATFRDILEPGIDIAMRGDVEEAEEYVELYIMFLLGRNPGWTRDGAHSTVMSNLGYYAGYYGPEEREAVQRVFGALHPVFGSATPTPDEAFAAGQRWAASNS